MYGTTVINGVVPGRLWSSLLSGWAVRRDLFAATTARQWLKRAVGIGNASHTMRKCEVTSTDVNISWQSSNFVETRAKFECYTQGMFRLARTVMTYVYVKVVVLATHVMTYPK